MSTKFKRVALRVLSAAAALTVALMGFVPVTASAKLTPGAEDDAPVATVSVDGVGYESLTAALTAISGTDTEGPFKIELLDDTTLEKTNTLTEKTVEIALNNHKVVGSSAAKIASPWADYELEITGGSLEGVSILSKNLVLSDVEVTSDAKTVECGGKASISDCSITSTSAKSFEFALKLAGGSYSAEVKNTNISAAAASPLYIEPGATVLIAGCSVSSTGVKPAIELTGGNQGSTVTISGTNVTAGTGSAIEIPYKGYGSMEIAGNSTVKGAVKLKFNKNSTDKDNSNLLLVSSGSFDNGQDMPFEFNSVDNRPDWAEERLLVRGGSYKVDVSEWVAEGYVCKAMGDVLGYAYKVIPDSAAKAFYTLDSTGSKVYAESIAEALKRDENVYASVDYALTDSDLSLLDSAQATLRVAGGAELGFSKPLKDLLSALGKGCLEGVNLKTADIELKSVTAQGGYIEACSLGFNRDNYQDYVDVIAPGRLFDLSDGAAFAVKPESDFVAKMGILGFDSVLSAINRACSNDVPEQIVDKITLLGDVTLQSSIPINLPQSAFELDLNGKTIMAGQGSSTFEIVRNKGGYKPTGASITIKNGSLISKDGFALATNGMERDIGITLSNVDAKGGPAALYLPASGLTTVIGGTYEGETGIQLCGGGLVVDGARIVATGQPELENAKPGTGSIQDGAAISIIKRGDGSVTDGYSAITEVKILSGTFISADGIEPIQAYDFMGKDEPVVWPDAGEKVDISGGSFSAPIDDQLFADGFGGSMKPNSNGQYVVVTEQQYTVKHLFEELGTGKFVEDEKLAPEEILIGDIDEDSQAKPKDVAGFTAKSIEQKPVASDGTTVVKIYYLRNSYEITFESNGGTTVEKQTVKYGEKVVKPADPVREGYTFDAWYSDKALTKAFDFTTALDPKTNEPAITLYAKWSVVEKPGPKPEKPIIHKVTFIPIVGGDEKIVVEVKDGDFVTLPNTPTHPGYTFAGWFKDKALKEPFEADKTAIAGDLTLYGGWHKNDSDDTTVTPELPKTGDDSMLPIAIAGVAGVAAVVAGIVIVVKRRNAK